LVIFHLRGGLLIMIASGAVINLKIGL